MYYQIINPSDTYTMRTDDPKLAVLAGIILGNGTYGVSDEAGNEILPIFLLDPRGLIAWCEAQYGCAPGALYANADKRALAACLNSVAICSLTDRGLWDMAVHAMTDPAARQAWLEAWHDHQRSSINNIGARAWASARSIIAAVEDSEDAAAEVGQAAARGVKPPDWSGL
jgi:hypothetical protein